MKPIKLLALIGLLLISYTDLRAHALWIEAAISAKTGQPVEVKIFYGEYASNEREEVSKWYSDVKEFSLWLSAPGKEKIRLNTTAGANFYTATFIPQLEGMYYLTVSHEAKELGGTIKYEFLSAAAVIVGNASGYQPEVVPIGLTVGASQLAVQTLGKVVKVKTVQNGKPLGKAKVSVFSPAGWTKEFITDDKGEVDFKPQWVGTYLLEVSTYEKVNGSHHGKEYKAFWRGSTGTVVVVK